MAPSILAADFSRLGDEARRAQDSGGDLIHIDVMDGHFVPNLTIGPDVVAAIRRWTTLPLHTHLMIENPRQFFRPFREAGSDVIIFHVEVGDTVSEGIQELRNLGCGCGLSLNPETPIAAVFPYLADIDVLLVMSVHPGFGGQEFMPESLGAIKQAREKALRSNPNLDIAVDGGINEVTAPQVVAAGANVLVAGTALFRSEDMTEAIRRLKRRLAA